MSISEREAYLIALCYVLILAGNEAIEALPSTPLENRRNSGDIENRWNDAVAGTEKLIGRLQAP